MKQYLGFASGLISFACFTIYNDRREFNRLTKELEEKYPKKNGKFGTNLSVTKDIDYTKFSKKK
jgi:hypothetical protein